MRSLILGEGPGSIKEENKIRIDVVPEWADVVCDLNEEIPEVAGKFDYIEAHHIFEHIEPTKQLKKIMAWVFSLLDDKGILDITVPYWHSESAVECIEHCRFFNENSFMNYYDNLYSKEMKLPQFKLVLNAIEDYHNHQQVHIKLTK